MKLQTVPMRFQTIGLTQAMQLLTSQTWLIKIFLKCKKILEKHNSTGIAQQCLVRALLGFRLLNFFLW